MKLSTDGILLLLGHNEDAHLREVARLVRPHLRPILLDIFDSANTVVLDLDAASSRILINTPILSFTSDDIVAVWNRQKDLLSAPNWSPLERAAATFRQREWIVFLRSLFQRIGSAAIMNDPARQYNIAAKPLQLILAEECGFLVPRTVICNDSTAVAALFDRADEIVYKSLTFADFPDQTGILTNHIDRAFFEANQDSIGKCPGIFQEFVEKRDEFRVTLVGDDLYCARIEAKKGSPAYMDWRRDHLGDIFFAGELPTEAERCLRRFQDRAGIAFGAYDLVRDLSGRIWFLECNPAGQYLWLKEKCGLDISPSVARWFVENVREGQPVGTKGL